MSEEAARVRRSESHRKYYEKNRGAILKKQRDRLARNPELTKERRRATYVRTREKRVAYQREYQKNNPEKLRDRQRAHTYGVPLGWYDAQIKEQNGCCALCRAHVSILPRSVLHIDHCHATGRVRGLLCQSCNTAVAVLEKYRDQIGNMLAYADNAVAYDAAHGQHPSRPGN